MRKPTFYVPSAVRGQTFFGFTRINKAQLKRYLLQPGTWFSGFIVGNKVASYHFFNGWHLAHSISNATLEETETAISAFLFHLDGELGDNVAIYQKEVQRPINPVKPKVKRRSRNREEARECILSIVSCAEIYQSESQTIESNFKELQSRFNLSLGDWQYLRGFFEGLTSSWKYQKTIHCYILNGEPVVYDKATQEQKDIIHGEVGQPSCPSGLFWLKNDTIGRPYFISEGVKERLQKEGYNR